MISKVVKIGMEVLFRNTGGCTTSYKVRRRYHCEGKGSKNMKEMRDSVLSYVRNSNLDNTACQKLIS